MLPHTEHMRSKGETGNKTGKFPRPTARNMLQFMLRHTDLHVV